MAPLFLWTAVLAALASLGSVGVSAMPMLTEQGEARLTIPSPILEWYLQQRDLQLREADQPDQPQQPQAQPLQLQPSELRQQFKQWLDAQLARLPAVAGDAEEPSKALVPQQPKRGNYMALCHFKICNMGRKRSPRIQPQDLP